MKISRKTLEKKSVGRGYLDGQMLIATPTMSDDRFARTVIYVCAHSSEGAMGIIVNQPAGSRSAEGEIVIRDSTGRDKVRLVARVSADARSVTLAFAD